MPSPHPIWQRLRDDGRYDLKWLARQTDFSHSHVKAVAAGIQAPSARFRAACARVLDLPEGVLFHGVSSASRPDEDSEPGSNGRAGIAVPRAYPAEEAVPIARTA